jgi:hypothetical protein
MKMDRDQVIAEIKTALQKRSGKSWSVTGGRGTAYGWITIDAPPKRRTFTNVPKPYNTDHRPGIEHYDEVDMGKPGGFMGAADRAELAKLLGLEGVHFQGVSIAASSDYYREYMDRANGKQPSVIAQPYWD